MSKLNAKEKLESIADEQLKRITVYGNKELIFDIRDKEHREAVIRAAKAIKLYEKLL